MCFEPRARLIEPELNGRVGTVAGGGGGLLPFPGPRSEPASPGVLAASIILLDGVSPVR